MKKTAFSTYGTGSTGACRRMQIDPYLSPCTKLTSKWIKNLHIKPDKLKLIEKTLGKSLEHIDTGENFPNRTPIAYALKSRIDKWDLIKLQSFCKAKTPLKGQNGNHQIGKGYSPTLHLIEG